MTVEDFDRIDGIGTHRGTRNPVLGISDHLPWDEYGEHFSVLEKKFATYINFIQSGEIWEHFRGEGRYPITIDLIYKFPPTPLAEHFLSTARDQLREEYGIIFQWHGLRKK